ncbi:hypothetical protein [Xanthomonas translucens]|uniref:hypothetical protein n=1 Tax=Xanthomonas campestris pv. translucens TaxID=343 RepID=UPI000A8E6D96|nr:hypothetical protein [Xanthomonas translucens]MCT8272377.1 hypothetical protein [Xanthomonas translucens pv. undulosa]WNJ32842.1 hypothetical protein RMA82_11065 [Xanthomonas translucens pv. undulosa]
MNAVTTAKPHATDPRSIFKSRYGNFIGGRWVEPGSGRYFDNSWRRSCPTSTSVGRKAPRC